MSLNIVYKAIFKSLAMLLLVVLVIQNTTAQNSTLGKAPEAPGFSSGSDVLGNIQQKVNLFTGQVTFPVTLVNVPSPGGLSMNVSLTYNSTGVIDQADTWNNDAPTSVIGLGWNLNTSKIIVNNKQTGTRDDDTYYLSDGVNNSELIRIGGSFTHEEFVLQNYQFWKIRFYPGQEKWEIIKEDGSKWIYGDTSSGRNTVEWIVKWGNWIGNSSNTSGQQRQGVAWNLSSVEVVTGQMVRYTYEEIKNRVSINNSIGQFHTEASYLSRIEDDLGQRVDLIYGNKATNEYVEPHTERGEPDAYQERYEKKFLDEVIVYNEHSLVVQRIDLVSSVENSWTYKKRLLREIRAHNNYGEFIGMTRYQYHTSGDYKGALQKIISNEGNETAFLFTDKTIPDSNRELVITSPGPQWKEPQTYVGPDYVVVFWREMENPPSYTHHQNDPKTVRMSLYTWDGEWVAYENLQTLPGVWQDNNDDANDKRSIDFYTYLYFHVAIEQDYFAFLYYNEVNDRFELHAYGKSADRKHGWDKELTVTNINHRPTASLLSGENYLAVGFYENEANIRTWVRNGEGWRYQTIPQRGHRTYYAPGPNYFVAHSGSGDDDITFYFLDKNREWLTRTVPENQQFDTDHDNGGIFNPDESPDSRWYCAPSFAFVLADDNEEFIYQWDEGYNNITQKAGFGSMNDYSFTQVTGNNLIVAANPTYVRYPEQGLVDVDFPLTGNIYSSGIKAAAFDGVNWHFRNIGTASSQHDVTIGDNAIAWSRKFGTGTDHDYVEVFNPNNLGSPWSRGTYGYSETGVDYDWTPAETNGKYFILKDKLHYRNPNGSIVDKGKMFAAFAVDDGWDVKFGYKDFILQDEGNNSRVLFLKNGAYYRSDYFSGVEHNSEWEGYGNYISKPSYGPNILVLGPDELANSRTLKLYRLSDYRAKGNHQLKVVERVSYNNQLQNISYKIVYDDEYPSVDADSNTPQFHKVTIGYFNPSNGSHTTEGYTEVYFVNGHRTGNMSTGNSSNGHLYPKLLYGSVYKTAQFDYLGNEVASSNTAYRVAVYEPTNTLGHKMDRVHTVRSVYERSETDGLVTVNETDYRLRLSPSLNDNGQVASQHTYTYDHDGNKDNISTEYKYAYDVYGANSLWPDNLMSPVVQSKTNVNGIVTSVEATRWAHFGSGIWAPKATYVRKRSGGDFTAWNSNLESDADWIKTSEIASRHLSGVRAGSPIQSRDVDGMNSVSKINASGFTYAEILNAFDNEVLIETFDDASFSDNEPYTWSTAGGNWQIDSEGRLKVPVNNSAGRFYQNWNAQSNNYIAELDVKMANTTNANAAFYFQFSKSSSSGFPTNSNGGHYLKIKPVQQEIEVLLRTGSPVTFTLDNVNVSVWHHYRVVRKGNNVMVYVDGTRVLNETVPGLTNGSFHGFYVEANSACWIDNLRIYPDDAYVTSSSFHPEYNYPMETVAETGLKTKSLYNRRNQVVATINIDGIPQPSPQFYSRSEVREGDLWTSSDPGIEHSSTPRGTQGYFDDFSEPKGNWSTHNGSSADSEWQWLEGELRMRYEDNGGGSVDARILSLEEAYQGRIGIEFDFTTPISNTSSEAGIAVGSGLWNGHSAGSSASWFFWKNNRFYVRNGTNTQLLNLGQTYHIKILLDTEEGQADVFLNGKLFSANVNFSGATPSIQKISFFNQSRGSSRTVYFDNLVIYTDPIQASTFYTADGKPMQVQTEEPDERLLVSESFFDHMGRPWATTKAVRTTTERKFGFWSTFANISGNVLSGDIRTLLTDASNDEQYAYSARRYERSPAGRVLESTSPGFATRLGQNTSRTEWHTNTHATAGILAQWNMGDEYPEGRYMVTKTTDPDGNSWYEMTNSAGQAIVSTRSTSINVIDTEVNYTTQSWSELSANFSFTPVASHQAQYSFRLVPIFEELPDDEGSGGEDCFICDDDTFDDGLQLAGETQSVNTPPSNTPQTLITQQDDCIDCPEGGIVPVDDGGGSRGGTGGGSGGESSPPSPVAPEFRILTSTGQVVVDWNNLLGENVPFGVTQGTTYTIEFRNYENDNAISSVSVWYANATEPVYTVEYEQGVRYAYDNAGNTTDIFPPNYFNPPSGSNGSDYVVHMQYDFLNRLTRRTTPDGGTEHYTYDNAGRITEYRDANADNERFALYYNYDAFGRTTEEGYIYKNIPASANIGKITSGAHTFIGTNVTANNTISSGAIVEAEAGNSLRLLPGFRVDEGGRFEGSIVSVANGDRIWRKRYTYGQHEKVAFDRGTPIVVETNNDRESDVEVVDAYEYNAYGELLQKRLKVIDYENEWQTIGYEYDNLGNVTGVLYGAGLDTVLYEYDVSGRMVGVGSEEDPFMLARYEYDNEGRLLSESINNAGLVSTQSYAYDFYGRLSEMRNPFLDQRFTYNGLLAEISKIEYLYDQDDRGWFDDEAPTSYEFNYTYYDIGWLKSATTTLGPEYSVNNITYDANGNFLNKDFATNSKDQNFRYLTGTNKVRNTRGNNADDYLYDRSGNIVRSVPKDLYLDYDQYFNLTKELNYNGGTLRFEYGSDNQRVLKINEGADGEDCTLYIHGANDYPLMEKHRLSDGTERFKYFVYGLSGLLAMRESSAGTTTSTVTATLEPANQIQESAAFGPSYDKGARPAEQLWNHTPGGLYSQRLTGRNNEVIGLAKTLQVSKGDLVQVEVFAKYNDQPPSDPNNIGSVIGANFTDAFGLSAAGETELAYEFFTDLFASVPVMASDNDHTKPAAYLNYFLFDNDFNLLRLGFTPVTESAAEDGLSCPGPNGCDHERLSLNIPVDANGTLYVYVSNESTRAWEVYFDDFSITQTTFEDWKFPIKDHLGSNKLLMDGASGQIVRAFDYAAFGDVLRTKGSEQIDYQYTGQEYDEEAEIHNYRARLYDSELGRFYGVDPQGQFHSPYTGMGNNPVMMVDPDGELAWFVIPVIVGAVTGTINAVSNYQSGDSFWDVAGSFGVGFVAGAGATLGAAAIAPAATAALGTGFLGGAAIGATGGAISGFALGAGNTWLDGGSFGQGLGNGFIGAGTGALIGGVTGGTFSGVKSVVQGRNFWTGAVKPIPTAPTLESIKPKGVDLGTSNKPNLPDRLNPVNTNAPKELPMHSNLTQGNSKMGLDHINLRHFEHTGAQNVSKFSGDVGARQLRDMIQSGLSDPSRIVTQQGTKIVVESNVGRIIGTTQSGAATTWIRTVFTSNGTVITSYPVPDPLSLIIR